MVAKKDSYDVDRHPVRLKSHSKSRDVVAARIRSQENFAARVRSHEKIEVGNDPERIKREKCSCYYEKDGPKYPSKLDMTRSRTRHLEDDRYREYPPVTVPTRSCIDPYRTRPPETREYREYDCRDLRARHYDDEKRRYFEQKTSRSFDVHREGYEEERACRRTARSDTNKEKRYDDREKRYDEVGKYYEEKPVVETRDRNNVSSKERERRWRKNVERFERNSVASREDDYRDRDRYSERERDSGLSVADGETSTMSGRSNCLKVVKVLVILPVCT